MVNNLVHYKVFSTFDLRNAYYQVPIVKDDRKYAGFEANGRLYQFRRIPFGVINGVAVFQRLMDNIIKEEKLTHSRILTILLLRGLIRQTMIRMWRLVKRQDLTLLNP